MIKLGADDAAGTDDDYFDMMAEFRGEEAYGYVYDSQIGYLAYALAHETLAERLYLGQRHRHRAVRTLVGD